MLLTELKPGGSLHWRNDPSPLTHPSLWPLHPPLQQYWWGTRLLVSAPLTLDLASPSSKPPVTPNSCHSPAGPCYPDSTLTLHTAPVSLRHSSHCAHGSGPRVLSPGYPAS